jgi:hypothetical protein
MVSTDKVSANQGWDYGYRKSDLLRGHEPFSASKVAPGRRCWNPWVASQCWRSASWLKTTISQPSIRDWSWRDGSAPHSSQEAGRLHLQTEKVLH